MLRHGSTGPAARAKGLSPEIAGFISALVDHFLSVWEKPERLTFHSRVLRRDDYECQSPGCGSRSNLEAHS